MPVEAFIDENFTKKGFIADWNKHVAPMGSPNYNDHVHIMRPLRAIDAETGGWRKTKDRAASKEEFADARGDEIEALRASWAKHVNAALADAGIPEEECERVDHRSNKRRGIEALPTVHEGRPAREMEARGERSDRITYNREIRQHNRILEEIKARAIQAGSGRYWPGLHTGNAGPATEEDRANTGADRGQARTGQAPRDATACNRRRSGREAQKGCSRSRLASPPGRRRWCRRVGSPLATSEQAPALSGLLLWSR